MWRYFLIFGFLCTVSYSQTPVQTQMQTWVPQTSGTTANLRGIHVVDNHIAWASGSQGTILRTIDGGITWSKVNPPGVADLDFRDIEAFDDRTAVAMSAGDGRQSRLYRTTDGGGTWAMIRANLEPEGFWDALAFWDPQHGILMGDPVKGRFTILTTADGGLTWIPREGPKAEKNEAAFAASGTALTVRGGHEAWFVTGGIGGARVMHTEDGGESWTPVRTPLRPTISSSGLYSIAFAPGGKLGIAVGGDYTKPADPAANIVVTSDGGKHWLAPRATESTPGGYMSAVAHVPTQQGWISVGTSGSEKAVESSPLNPFPAWSLFDPFAYNALHFAVDGIGWAVGPQGAIGKFTPDAR